MRCCCAAQASALVAMAALLSRITWDDWRVTGTTAVALLLWYAAARSLLLPAIYGRRPDGDRASEAVSVCLCVVGASDRGDAKHRFLLARPAVVGCGRRWGGRWHVAAA